MILRPALVRDIPSILHLEQAPHARPFVSSWSAEEHELAMMSPDARYFILEETPGVFAGFAILRGLTTPHRAIELKRVALLVVGRGLGRVALEAILRTAFAELHAHKVWLDVYEHNARARHLYTSLGFREDGVLRDADCRDGQFQSLILMSMLEDEYDARRG